MPPPPSPLSFSPSFSGTQTSFNARCAESNDATNASDAVNYAVGTMVWTLFDYYGEPPVGGPEVSSTYGQYDLCGFPKAAAFWYRTQVPHAIVYSFIGILIEHSYTNV